MWKVINGWSHYASELSNLKWKAEILPEVEGRKMLHFLFQNLPPQLQKGSMRPPMRPMHFMKGWVIEGIYSKREPGKEGAQMWESCNLSSLALCYFLRLCHDVKGRTIWHLLWTRRLTQCGSGPQQLDLVGWGGEHSLRKTWHQTWKVHKPIPCIFIPATNLMIKN